MNTLNWKLKRIFPLATVFCVSLIVVNCQRDMGFTKTEAEAVMGTQPVFQDDNLVPTQPNSGVDLDEDMDGTSACTSDCGTNVTVPTEPVEVPSPAEPTTVPPVATEPVPQPTQTEPTPVVETIPLPEREEPEDVTPEPPVVPTPTPVVVSTPVSTPTPRVPVNSGGSSGADEEDDPLMIDTIGEEYDIGSWERIYREDDETSEHYEYVSTVDKEDHRLEFSSRENGISFDILGDYGIGEKIQISWTRNVRYKFLALPKMGVIDGVDHGLGRIYGINELFGNNTVNERDQVFGSENGFEALKKYNTSGEFGEPDSQIDRYDERFDDMRVWVDLNYDGLVSSDEEARNELMSLSQARILSIHLAYLDTFGETDPHGNRIEFKSVVTFADYNKNDNKVRRGIAFDVWFRTK